VSDLEPALRQDRKSVEAFVSGRGPSRTSPA